MSLETRPIERRIVYLSDLCDILCGFSVEIK